MFGGRINKLRAKHLSGITYSFHNTVQIITLSVKPHPIDFEIVCHLIRTELLQFVPDNRLKQLFVTPDGVSAIKGAPCLLEVFGSRDI